MKQVVSVTSLLLFIGLFCTGANAEATKVVVVPMVGDNTTPQFRIVPAGSTTEANRGRLEYTADRNPTPQSTWGTVCAACFAGDIQCDGNPFYPSSHAAANAVCMDLGYTLGLVDGTFANTGTLPPTLGEVFCPDGADSFKDCTSGGTDSSGCGTWYQAGVYCMDVKLVFATSETYNGNLVKAANDLPGDTVYTDGLLAADALCQNSVNDAGLPGIYKAWLSSASGSPSTRFTRSDIPYVLPDGSVVATDYQDLTDGTLLYPINESEYGATIFFGFEPETELQPSSYAFTSTFENGTPNLAQGDCQGWTSWYSDDQMSGGLTASTSHEWTRSNSWSCEEFESLICFQQ